MSGAYIELLPPDRPIFMLGQPIIKLVATGGPGGDLGEVGQSAYLSPSDLGCCGEDKKTGLDATGMGCCGSGALGELITGCFGPLSGMNAEEAAKALKARCDGLEKRIADTLRQLVATANDRYMAPEIKRHVAVKARADIKALKADFKVCYDQLKKIVKGYRKDFAAAGMSDVQSLAHTRRVLAKIKRRQS